MTSLAAQEYFALKILNTISENSDLCKFKFDLYKNFLKLGRRLKLCSKNGDL